MSENRSDLENMAMALYVYAAELIKEGKSPQQVIDILIERGITRESAETIMTRLNESRANVSRKSAYPNVAFGLFVIALSLFPLLGIVVERATGVSVMIAILVMAVGVIITGRALMRIFGI